ncbi:MAG: DUF2961 domain-containing protein [Alphaproteobacteria bacterium]|nr:DUF2961 domain-containing protein [Alphaproteobacteria bacterium]
MSDADRLARFPDPAPTVTLHASWDRAQLTEGFANADRGQFEGERTFGDRVEHALVDADGPGAIVRTWAANPKAGGTLRIRLDGAERPAVEVPLADWLPGGPAGGHLSMRPLPYAEHLLVTVDDNAGRGLYWQVETATWPADTPMHTWRGRWPAGDPMRGWQGVPDGPLDTVSGQRLELTGPGAVRRLRIRGEGTLRWTFDDATTAEVPLADLRSGTFDLGPWAYDGQTLTGRLTMPFARSAVLELRGEGTLEADVGPWDWDERSMHLRARTATAEVDTRQRTWFEVLSTEGRGVYVGEVLAVDNPSPRWWGEGDDEVTVDGAITHRGTGTEDWYGYAWCSAATYSAPWTAKPRDDAAGAADPCEEHGGTSVQARFRALDALPYASALRVRFEVHHKDRATRLSLRSTAFWYEVPPLSR